eukprot:467323_1
MATKFAKYYGMLIQLNNRESHSKILRFWDCQWISTFPEEDERLFIGGDWRIRIESILISETCVNYPLHFNALYLLDCMLNGVDMEDSPMNITPKDKQIISSLIKYRLNMASEKEIDEYIYDTFDFFCYKQKQITVNLHFLEKHFSNCGLSHLIIDHRANYKNLLKSDVLQCFTNTNTIVINTFDRKSHKSESYPLSLSSLSILIERYASPSLQKIVINGELEGWLTRQCLTDFTINPIWKQTFASHNFKLSFERPKISKKHKQDCLIIIRSDINSEYDTLIMPQHLSKHHTMVTNPNINKYEDEKKQIMDISESTSQSETNAHSSSNSIAPTSIPTLNDIETIRDDMRDILWQNAELLQSDPNYRKKVWRYMSKVFYGNQS